MSLLRLALIPLMMWLYLEQQEYVWTFVVLVLSGITDTLDGFIARKYNMISEFGKAFDPVADKLTQVAMLHCLGTTFPEIRYLLALLVIKEFISGIMSIISIQKTGQVQGAEWHGKVTTVLLYVLIADRMIPGLLSMVLMILTAGMMVLSMVLYVQRHWKSIQQKR